MSDFIATFIIFFAVIDPIGTVPVFVAVTYKYSDDVKKMLAIKSTVIAMVLLLFFIIAGEIILTALDIPIAAFQIAGGVVLFLFALTMVLGIGKINEEVKHARKIHEEAVYPLAIPSLASPGAILAAVLLTENNRFNLYEQVVTALSMLCILVIALLLMLVATRVQRLLGASGVSIISRVMGMILASVAVAHILAGVKDYFMI